MLNQVNGLHIYAKKKREGKRERRDYKSPLA